MEDATCVGSNIPDSSGGEVLPLLSDQDQDQDHHGRLVEAVGLVESHRGSSANLSWAEIERVNKRLIQTW